MDLVLKIALLVILFLAGGKLLIEVGSYFYATWPRTFDSANLDQDFRGLILFGKNGTYVSLTKHRSQDRMCFTKREGGDPAADCIEVRLSSPGLGEQAAGRIIEGLDALGSGLTW